MTYEITTEENVPTWALPYLVNNDPTGLTDEDAAMVDEWAQQFGPSASFSPTEDEPGFTPYPAFGLACNTVDVNVIADTEETDAAQ